MREDALTVEGPEGFMTVGQLAIKYEIGKTKALSVIRAARLRPRHIARNASYLFYNVEIFGKHLIEYNQRIEKATQAKLKAKGTYQMRGKSVRKWAAIDGIPLKEALKIMKMAWVNKATWEAAKDRFYNKTEAKCWKCDRVVSRMSMKRHEDNCQGKQCARCFEYVYMEFADDHLRECRASAQNPNHGQENQRNEGREGRNEGTQEGGESGGQTGNL